MSGCSGAIYLVRLPNDGRRSHLGNPDADFASRERKNATPKDGIFTLLLAPRYGHGENQAFEGGFACEIVSSGRVALYRTGFGIIHRSLRGMYGNAIYFSCDGLWRSSWSPGLPAADDHCADEGPPSAAPDHRAECGAWLDAARVGSRVRVGVDGAGERGRPYGLP